MAFKQIIEGLAELKRSRDEFLHDFVRAAVDALHAGIRDGTGDWVFQHVPVAAVELQALVDRPCIAGP